MIFAFLAGAVLGLLVGWWAKGTFATAPTSENDSGRQSLSGAFAEALKVVVLLAVAAVVIFVMANTLAHARR